MRIWVLFFINVAFPSVTVYTYRMGKQDIAEKTLLSYNDVFADILKNMSAIIQ